MAGFSDSEAAAAAAAAGLDGTLYLALNSAVSTTGASELSGNGYARVAVTLTETSRTWATDADADFTASGGDFLEALGCSLWTALTGGTCKFSNALAAAKTIADGETGKVAAGAVTVTV